MSDIESEDDENPEGEISYSMLAGMSSSSLQEAGGVDLEGNRLKDYTPEQLLIQQISIIIYELENLVITKKPKILNFIKQIVSNEKWKKNIIEVQVNKIPPNIKKNFINAPCFVIACICYIARAQNFILTITPEIIEIIENVLITEIKGEIFTQQDLVRYYRFISNNNR